MALRLLDRGDGAPNEVAAPRVASPYDGANGGRRAETL